MLAGMQVKQTHSRSGEVKVVEVALTQREWCARVDRFCTLCDAPTLRAAAPQAGGVELLLGKGFVAGCKADSELLEAAAILLADGSGDGGSGGGGG
eukprot:CAMPEP_0181327164 /NCGR_PEP_ID=MMETSP1101-20121128/21936_1 /TAXON_ID=46948 /ORGANISM="Rhodomonas abbreviata, Strain Caron Lab Isolate" /LENGTH=95 /DNA_ID=CAMNT_0023435767 /DNA_START=1 /DNA_END=284 /DNA_ORIENTATION=+